MSAAPGWYPQSDGSQRYWDGEAWTEHVHRVPQTYSPPGSTTAPSTRPRRTWAVGLGSGIGGFLLGAVLVAAGSAATPSAGPDPQEVRETTALTADLQDENESLASQLESLEQEQTDSESALDESAEALDASRAELLESQQAVTEARQRLVDQRKAARAAQRKAVARAIRQERSRQAASRPQPLTGSTGGGGNGSGSDTDPRFDTCGEAQANGYGNYRQGVDPEYDWYEDRDGDGVVCE